MVFNYGGFRCFLNFINYINDIATDGIRPDITFLLDCSPFEGISRINKSRKPSMPSKGLSDKDTGTKDRFESEGMDFYQSISSGYLELAKLYPDRWIVINAELAESIIESEIILSGIKGMLDPLDPFTKILMGRSKERYELLVKGKYGGVGMSISSARDTIIIRQVFEDSPSYSEGLMAGDMILKIDTTSTIGLKYSEAVKLLKGEVDTPVNLLIYRNPGKIKKKFMLRRSNIKLKHIPYWGLDENKIGYIKLTKFSKNTSKDFKEALLSMSRDGLKGLILDLRSNGGGLLREAINILDLILPKNTIEPILIKRGRNNEKKYFSRNDPVIDPALPIVLLQDKKSASASEIVSGSLQDLDRAIISGQNSVGKGLVQMNNPLNDSMNIKITTSKYIRRHQNTQEYRPKSPKYGNIPQTNITNTAKHA